MKYKIECKFCKIVFDSDRKKIFCSNKCCDHFHKKETRKRNYKQSLSTDEVGRVYNYRNRPKGLMITKSNIDLYCKLSQIIRDKPCKPNQVFAQQRLHFKRVVLP